MLSNHLVLCCPLLLLPSVFPSVTAFSSELAFCIRWPKYWSFSFSISLSSEYSGLISFGLTDLISLLSREPSRVFSTPQFKSISSSVLSLRKSENWHWYNFVIDLDCILPNIPTLDPSPTRGPMVHQVVPPSFPGLPQPQYFGCTKASSSTCPSVWFVWCSLVSGFRLCIQGWTSTDGMLCSQSLWSGGTRCWFVLFPVMSI